MPALERHHKVFLPPCFRTQGTAIIRSSIVRFYPIRFLSIYQVTQKLKLPRRSCQPNAYAKQLASRLLT